MIEPLSYCEYTECKYLVLHNSRDYDTEVYTVTLYWRVIFIGGYEKKYFQNLT